MTTGKQTTVPIEEMESYILAHVDRAYVEANRKTSSDTAPESNEPETIAVAITSWDQLVIWEQPSLFGLNTLTKEGQESSKRKT